MLEEVVSKTVTGEALLPHSGQVLRRHQTMLFVQIAAQLAHQLSFIKSLNTSQDFGRKNLSFNTGDCQGFLPFLIQAFDALLNDTLNFGR